MRGRARPPALSSSAGSDQAQLLGKPHPEGVSVLPRKTILPTSLPKLEQPREGWTSALFNLAAFPQALIKPWPDVRVPWQRRTRNAAL